MRGALLRPLRSTLHIYAVTLCITLGDKSRLEVESASARDFAERQRIRADEAVADSERAHQRAAAANDDAQDARDSESTIDFSAVKYAIH